jgi:hypothetical protein
LILSSLLLHFWQKKANSRRNSQKKAQTSVCILIVVWLIDLHTSSKKQKQPIFVEESTCKNQYYRQISSRAFFSTPPSN